MKRWEFKKSEPCPILGVTRGTETWIWVTWAVLLFLTVAVGFFMMGKVSERRYFTPLIQGMISQHEAGCESSPWVHKETKKSIYGN